MANSSDGTAEDPSSDLSALCPDCAPETIERFRRSFPPRYFSSFSREAQAAHLAGLATLSRSDPVRVLIEAHEGDYSAVTVLGFDYPGEFSIIAGLLAASGFEVTSGDVYTSLRSSEADRQSAGERFRYRRRGSGGRMPGGAGRAIQRVREPERWIVDYFVGTVRSSVDEWVRHIPQRLHETIATLAKGSADAYEEAKRRVSDAAAAALTELDANVHESFEPARMEVDQTPRETTRLMVYSKDTPFFLYALSSALHLHGVSIESVDIRTSEGWAEDSFEITDMQGRPVSDEKTLNQLRLSAAFTKQFTYFLDRAPDPYRALQRFELLIQDFRALSEAGQMNQLLSSPNVLQDLARLLGASDFLWEDFLRLHYEQLVPMLAPERRGGTLSLKPGEIAGTLDRAVASAHGTTEKKRVLNEFKDHHAYLIDVDHILARNTDFFFLSRRLTALAEAVVNTSVEIAWEELNPRYGVPRTVAGIEATYTVMGLGKMGGEALGYASDIEVLFLYSDNGQTDGADSVSNREFFEELFHTTVGMIKARREGIFQLDLRLRPHGNAGPLAVSMASFLQYYRSEASSLEKLALVRMRWIGGDQDFGHRTERVRDELIYGADSIDLPELQSLRNIQLKEKGDHDRLNAKFSPGGLVDLEYSVQILQVTLGRGNPALRTPRIHEALSALVTAGEIEQEESERLVGAYRFLRQLINGLRMLRGNAQDLFLPDEESLEFIHLARRAGYSGRGNLTPAQELRVEFETRTAEVRAFVEEQLGKDALPGDAPGNIADLVVTEHMELQRYRAILEPLGFRDPERAYRNLKSLAGSGPRRYRFAEVAILAWDLLMGSPDPGMALNNWEQFVHAAGAEPAARHFSELVSQPKRLEILLAIFAGSQFLSNTLIRNPEFFGWATSPTSVWQRRGVEDYQENLQQLRVERTEKRDWLNAIRRFRKQEILRIGTRDICLNVAIEDVMAELSALASEIIRHATTAVFDRIGLAEEARERICILAFGKLGARELNYSSDVDLIGVYRPGEAPREEDLRQFAAVMKNLRADLSDHMEEGYVYRVDLRLRPHGTASPIAQTIDSVLSYYSSSAAPWEQQALLRLRPIAGSRALGEELLERLREPFFATWQTTDVRGEIRGLRGTAVAHHGDHGTLAPGTRTGAAGQDIKNGVGGLRDIEFLVQGLQILHSRGYPELLLGNTLDAVTILEERSIIPGETAAFLTSGYTFLRRVEHFLQMLEDRQVHRLPSDDEGFQALARRIEQAEGLERPFAVELQERMTEIRGLFDYYMTST